MNNTIIHKKMNLPIINPDQISKDGKTTLMQLCSIDMENPTETFSNLIYNTIALLIESKANIDLEDEEGWTTLIYALDYNNMKVVELLIDNNASICKRITTRHVCRTKNLEIFQLLIKKDKFLPFIEDSRSVLMYLSVYSENDSLLEIVKFLINHGAKPENYIFSAYYPILYEIYAYRNNREITKILLQIGTMDLNLDRNYDGVTMLMEISRRNDVELCALWLEYKFIL